MSALRTIYGRHSAGRKTFVIIGLFRRFIRGTNRYATTPFCKAPATALPAISLTTPCHARAYNVHTTKFSSNHILHLPFGASALTTPDDNDSDHHDFIPADRKKSSPEPHSPPLTLNTQEPLYEYVTLSYPYQMKNLASTKEAVVPSYDDALLWYATLSP